MASLGDSLRVKAAGVKAPAVTGQRPLKSPEAPIGSGGSSGGIARSKSVKNAGSTSTGNSASPASSFIRKTLGVPSLKNKTNDYF